MSQQLPLGGVKVIEFCNVAAGPYCGMLLADMGADVIKVEHPGGDSLRAWPPLSNGYSENFASLNRNKRSVTLDLKDANDVLKAKKLVSDADILLENNRPGVMTRLGLDYAALVDENPKLVYVSISAFGQQGPRAKEGGFDLTLQAMSGVMSVTGEEGGAPVKCGVPLTDFAAGLYGAFAAAAALRTAQKTGRGVHIDVPMLGTSLAIAALQTSEYFGSDKDPVKLGSKHPRNAPYQAFRCKDGHFAMAAGNNALWAKVCKTLEITELCEDPRFSTPALRAANQEELRVLLEEIFIQSDAEHWLEKFRSEGVPCAPINRYSEALCDPQVEYMNWVQEVELPNGLKTKTFVSPLSLDGRGLPLRYRPPALGEHNEEVFSEEVAE